MKLQNDHYSIIKDLKDRVIILERDSKVTKAIITGWNLKFKEKQAKLC